LRITVDHEIRRGEFNQPWCRADRQAGTGRLGDV
jgi:hypothetical protein